MAAPAVGQSATLHPLPALGVHLFCSFGALVGVSLGAIRKYEILLLGYTLGFSWQGVPIECWIWSCLIIYLVVQDIQSSLRI